MLGALIIALYAFWFIYGTATSRSVAVEPSVTVSPLIPVPEVTANILPYVPLQRVTAYNALAWQTDADPHIASCGPNQSNQIALSRDLFFDSRGRKHLCGVEAMIVTERGEVFNVVVFDTMNARYRLTADIFMDDLQDAYNFGRTSGVLVLRNSS